MHLLCPGALVLAYPVAQPDAMPARADDVIMELLGQAAWSRSGWLTWSRPAAAAARERQPGTRDAFTLRETLARPQRSQPHLPTPADQADLNGIAPWARSTRRHKREDGKHGS
jgi:hypothetical protein